MPVVSVEKAQLAYGHVALLAKVDFSIEPGERVALIGRNGTGKSSLIKAIAGISGLDDGKIVRQAGVRVAFVAQEPDFEPGLKVFAAVAGGLSVHAGHLSEYEEVADKLAAGDESEALMERLSELQTLLDANDAWTLKNRIERVLTQLNLRPNDALAQLSGGTLKRVALARALVAEPDLLLLDEPTNHLDVESIIWLEDLLLTFRGAVIAITHDRQFLDRIATRVVELDRGVLRSYPGNYSAYENLKEQELASEAVSAAQFDKVLAAEEAWIRKGVEGRRTRSSGRVKRLEQLRRDRAERRNRQGDVKFAISEGDRSGKLVAELTDCSMALGGRTLIKDFSAIIQRGDRIGIIGSNGIGKTTLLKLILGELQPDSGEVRRGSNLQVAYFDQMRTKLDPEATLADTISPGSDFIEIGTERTHVMSYLGRFLFAPERARSPVKSLSGGERNRLLLARLFARPTNLIVLDEPTNDLDIETLDLLEELLASYKGTAFIVSHDRAFLDDVVTQTIAALGNGRWREYVGGYTDYVRQRGDEGAAGGSTAPGSTATLQARPAQAAVSKASKPGEKLTQSEKRDLAELPDRISRLEAEQATLSAALANPATYQAQGTDVKTLSKRISAIENELMTCLERWEALEARRT